MSNFMAVSKQAYELDHERVRLEAQSREMQTESSRWAKVRVKLEEEVKKLKNLIEELKANVVEKDTRLDHLQKSRDELCTLLGEAKEQLSKSSQCLVSTLISWTRTTLWDLKISIWMRLSFSMR